MIGWQMEIFHIVGAVSFFSDKAFSCWAKSFNCILLSFLHFDVWICFYAWNCFASMNLVRIDWMSIQILHNFNWVNLSFDLNLIRFHSLLNKSSNISKSNINTCLLETCISCIFNSLEKFIISWIECDCESCINDSSVDMSTKINFANIVISEDCIISGIRSVVSCTMVYWTASWEGNAWFESIFRS